MKKLDLTNQIFGRLIVIKESQARKANRVTWLCRCSCGNLKAITGSDLKSGHVNSCGCLHDESSKKKKNHIGTTKETWLILEELPRNKHNQRVHLGKCLNCGETKELRNFHKLPKCSCILTTEYLQKLEHKRFYEKVNIKSSNDCWEWKATKMSSNGYGVFRRSVSLKNCQIGAHRMSWILEHKQEIPTNMCVCHHCDNPSCVNPAHLFLGTQKDNLEDMLSKNRQASWENIDRKGIKNNSAKLTEQEVLNIRKDFKNGKDKHQLAVEYNVTSANINLIITQKTWRHL